MSIEEAELRAIFDRKGPEKSDVTAYNFEDWEQTKNAISHLKMPAEKPQSKLMKKWRPASLP